MRFSGVFELSEKKIVYVLILTLMFLFVASWIRVSLEVVYTSPSDYPIVIEHYGFPFEIMGKKYTHRTITIVFKGSIQKEELVESTIEFVPAGIALDFLTYGALSFVIIKLSEKITDEIDYRKYSLKD